MLQIGGAPAGLLGLDEVFAELFREDCAPELTETQERLIKAIRKQNFIAKPALDEYKAVLSREYQRYYEQCTAGREVTPKNYGTWQGIPREQIPLVPDRFGGIM